MGDALLTSHSGEKRLTEAVVDEPRNRPRQQAHFLWAMQGVKSPRIPDDVVRHLIAGICSCPLGNAGKQAG
ncbi:MAG TPA: hypothetical protein VFI82_04290 [Terriglobales bacterium]|nr:hypothetical protein [Terriglobales bacterium]